jgi:DNA-binding transcriptional ArsR family regulator
MTARIHFEAEDLARVAIARPDEFGETLFSIMALRPWRGGMHLAGWRERTLPTLQPSSRLLLDIYPGRHSDLDVLSVVGPGADFAESLERLSAARAADLDAECAYLAGSWGEVPPAVGALVRRDRHGRFALPQVIARYHDEAVAPHWPGVRAHLEEFRDRAAGLLVDGGVDALFTSLRDTGIVWKPPVLEVPSTAARYDHHLGGRGLLLVPSLFYGPRPALLRSLHPDRPDAPPDVLVHPMSTDLLGADRIWSAPPGDALAALLGATRAKILAVAAGGASTTELADRAGVSPPSASEHATVLRRAGLLTTQRLGQAVRHQPTELGCRLLGRHQSEVSRLADRHRPDQARPSRGR